MDFVSIKRTIDDLKKELEVFDNVDFGDLTPSLNVVEFNQIVEKLKEKNLQETSESEFFKNVLNTADYYENISSYLEQTRLSLEQKIKKSGVSPNANAKLQQSLETIQNTIDILVVEYANITRNEKKRWFGAKNSGSKKEIRAVLSELLEIKEKIEKATYLDSKVVSNVVLKEFKSIFTFFSNCIKVAKSRGDELLLVEVAGIADRIMSMINPVFRNKSLSTDALIYYYLFYELGELKSHAIGDRLA
ncbi:hypothetical protein [Campylobacter gastrosuis]|uniref:Uncharacterized protein n=1 Tax=Campylobacter gastrosuis TaxID=2974576 RepID=A0ABT7HSD5_9BACT|nr:hypothetical protein [Campylobacter gastrosuis]MDL0089739.1 hypothetical protein [Campylobacter gastrosuis]